MAHGERAVPGGLERASEARGLSLDGHARDRRGAPGSPASTRSPPLRPTARSRCARRAGILRAWRAHERGEAPVDRRGHRDAKVAARGRGCGRGCGRGRRVWAWARAWRWRPRVELPRRWRAWATSLGAAAPARATGWRVRLYQQGPTRRQGCGFSLHRIGSTTYRGADGAARRSLGCPSRRREHRARAPRAASPLVSTALALVGIALAAGVEKLPLPARAVRPRAVRPRARRSLALRAQVRLALGELRGHARAPHAARAVHLCDAQVAWRKQPLWLAEPAASFVISAGSWTSARAMAASSKPSFIAVCRCSSAVMPPSSTSGIFTAART